MSVARGLAPGVAPSGFGGVGAGAGVGAQRLGWRRARRQGWRLAASVASGWARGLAPDYFSGAGPGRKWWRTTASVMSVRALGFAFNGAAICLPCDRFGGLVMFRA